MQNSASRLVVTLAVALTIAMPLIINPPVIAQSDVNGKLTAITKSTNDGPTRSGRRPAATGCITVEHPRSSRGTPSTATAPTLAFLAVVKYSGAHIDEIANTGSRNPKLEGAPKAVIQVISSRDVSAAGDALPLCEIQTPKTRSHDSVMQENYSDPETSAGNIFLSAVTDIDVVSREGIPPNSSIIGGTALWNDCIGGIHVGIARFTRTAVLPATTVPSPLDRESGNTLDTIALGKSFLVTNNSSPDRLSKRGDSTSSEVRIGGIVIK